MELLISRKGYVMINLFVTYNYQREFIILFYNISYINCTQEGVIPTKYFQIVHIF